MVGNELMAAILCIPVEELPRRSLWNQTWELIDITALAKAILFKDESVNELYEIDEYRFGTGQNRFFYTRLGWVADRYDEIINEIKSRNLPLPQVSNLREEIENSFPIEWKRNWSPDEYDMEVCNNYIKKTIANKIIDRKIKYKKIIEKPIKKVTIKPQCSDDEYNRQKSYSKNGLDRAIVQVNKDYSRAKIELRKKYELKIESTIKKYESIFNTFLKNNNYKYKGKDDGKLL